MPKCQYYLNLNEKPDKLTPKTNPIENCQKQFCQKNLEKPSKKSNFHGFSYIYADITNLPNFHQCPWRLRVPHRIRHQVMNLLLIDGIVRSEKWIFRKSIAQFFIGRRGRNQRWFGLGRGGDEVRSY